MIYNINHPEDKLLQFVRQMRAIEDRVAAYGAQSTPARFALRPDITSLSSLRVATVMDPFSVACFAPECTLLELSSDGYLQEIRDFMPDLLLVESAWRGKDAGWNKRVDRLHPDIRKLFAYCREGGIPIAFWNKEDPIHLEDFIDVARLCDYVFTTDVDCVMQYRQVLGHDRVEHLHFAAQPAVHNPVEAYDRQNKLCFAGSYYRKYEERSRVMDRFFNLFISRDGMDIYDRNYGADLPFNQFPKRYQPYILGRLDPKDIDKAYKGYRYGLNMNTIKQSQSMFARRIFELMASNTVVVGNYARGAKNYFGDLTICSDDTDTLARMLDTYCRDDVSYGKYRLLGLRRVLQSHLYEDRLDQIVRAVFGVSLRRPMPKVVVLARGDTPADRARTQAQFDRQAYPDKTLLFCDGDTPIEPADENTFYAAFDARDYYGPHYLTDLLLSVRYSDKEGFAKPSDSGEAYRPTDRMTLRRGVLCAARVRGMKPSMLWDTPVSGDFLCVDPFHYKRDAQADSCPEVDDLWVADQGITPELMQENHRPIAPDSLFGTIRLTPDALLESIRGQLDSRCDCTLDNGLLHIHSRLKPYTSQYIEFKQQFKPSPYANIRKLMARFDVTGALDVTGVCFFLDRKGTRMHVAHFEPGRVMDAPMPKGAASFTVGLYVRDVGDADLSGIALFLGDPVKMNRLRARGGPLVLTDVYPDETGNGDGAPLHRTLLRWKEQGVPSDVMRLDEPGKIRTYYDCEGIPVLQGKQSALEWMLSDDVAPVLCLYRPSGALWAAARPFFAGRRVILWDPNAPAALPKDARAYWQEVAAAEIEVWRDAEPAPPVPPSAGAV